MERYRLSAFCWTGEREEGVCPGPSQTLKVEDASKVGSAFTCTSSSVSSFGIRISNFYLHHNRMASSVVKIGSSRSTSVSWEEA